MSKASATARFAGDTRDGSLRDDLSTNQGTVSTLESGRGWALEIVHAPEKIAALQTGLAQLLAAEGDGRVSARDIALVQIGAIEAVNHIVWHAYDGRADQPFWLEALCDSDAVRLHLRDRGNAFRLGQAPPSALEASSERELGWLLIRSVFDSIDVFRDKQGENHLVLVRKFRQ